MEEPPMEFKGINHLALVCRDMDETVRFYRDMLGMPLVKTVALPGGGQHFFFDCGSGNCVAFFWWPAAAAAAPGIAAPKVPLDMRNLESAIGSMNHVAFTVAEERLGEYRDRLIAAGVETFAHIVNHDDSEEGYSATPHPGVFLRSVYFMDPNGILLEFAAQMRSFTARDVSHAPKKSAKVLEKV
jgi:catechol 2,3-dioxygenase-like lactoylglutathione lyase family enzyme